MSFFSGITDAIKGITGTIGDIVDPISSIISGGASLLGGMQTNSANADMARQQMAFQAQQTGSAYQRAVADMKKAGLNPMLAYSQGGASSGSGATAQMQNALDLGVSSARQSASVRSSISTQAAQRDLTAAQIKQTAAQTETAKTAADLNRANAVKAMADADLSQTNAKAAALNNTLKATTLQRALNDQWAAKTWYGKYVMPFLPDWLGHAAKSATSAGVTAILK